MREQNWSYDALGNSPFAAAVAGRFHFEKEVRGPFHPLEEFVRQKQTEFIGIRHLGRSRLFFFFPRWWRWAFFVPDIPYSEFILPEYGWVEWDLSPISKSVSRFHADGGRSAVTVESLELAFGRDAEPVRQSHFHFLGEEIIGRAVVKNVALVNCVKSKSPGWQDIRGDVGG